MRRIIRYDVSRKEHRCQNLSTVSSRREKRRNHEKENVLLRETHVCRWPNAHQLHNDGKDTWQYCRGRSSIGAEESASQASAAESKRCRGRRSSIFCV